MEVKSLLELILSPYEHNVFDYGQDKDNYDTSPCVYFI